jgi:ATP-dependent DNA helicase RecQ
MARERPATLDALGVINGVGAKKLDAYGPEILRVLQAGGTLRREAPTDAAPEWLDEPPPDWDD